MGFTNDVLVSRYYRLVQNDQRVQNNYYVQNGRDFIMFTLHNAVRWFVVITFSQIRDMRLTSIGGGADEVQKKLKIVDLVFLSNVDLEISKNPFSVISLS